MSKKEQWYLRDFDFFPEKVSLRKDLTSTFFQEAEEGMFKLFDSESDALEACIRVRALLGMENKDWLFDKFKESIVNDRIKDKKLFKLWQR